jgi:carbonic anhydrase
VAEVGIVQHTGCGLEGVGNDTLARETGLVGVDFLPFDQVEDSVAADVDRLLAAGTLPPGTVVWGGVYDLADGRIRLVREPSPVG